MTIDLTRLEEILVAAAKISADLDAYVQENEADMTITQDYATDAAQDASNLVRDIAGVVNTFSRRQRS